MNAVLTPPPDSNDGANAQAPTGFGHSTATGIVVTAAPDIHPIEIEPAIVNPRRARRRPRDESVSIDVATDTGK